jgi:hypothetical protein
MRVAPRIAIDGLQAAPRIYSWCNNIPAFPWRNPSPAGFFRNSLLRTQFYPAGSSQVKD